MKRRDVLQVLAGAMLAAPGAAARRLPQRSIASVR